MITIKNKVALQKMEKAGQLLATIFADLSAQIIPGKTTLEIDRWIDDQLIKSNLESTTKGFMSYKHASCISLNDEVVHGVPKASTVLKDGDAVTVDICASWKGYCADMARVFYVGKATSALILLNEVAKQALDKGIKEAIIGNRLSDISAAIQQEVESYGFGVVRDFAGHGIGKRMHEDPEILNYGNPGRGPVLQAGMTFAIEPMITMGKYATYVTEDGWTVKTVDGSMAAHVEDTVAITEQGPKILTRI
jgi:methionyl aminopeptidase